MGLNCFRNFIGKFSQQMNLRIRSTLTLWMAVRSACLVLFVISTLQVFHEFWEKNPKTVTTFSHHSWDTAKVKVKICNSVLLDPDKILNYNGTDLKRETYQFLYEAVMGNFDFNDTGWVLTENMIDYFAVSSRVTQTFKMDVEQFLLSCSLGAYAYYNCSTLLQYYDEPFMPCYQAIIDLGGYGYHHSLGFYMYFDPRKILGRYTKSIGTHVVVSHPEQEIPFINGNFIGPNERLTLSGFVIYKSQAYSLPKSKCTKRGGLETHDFTGEPFETSYSVSSCINICYAELTYKECNCPPFSGMNLTKTECLEQQSQRECVLSEVTHSKVEKPYYKCASECLNKCDEKQINFSPLRANIYSSSENLLSVLNQITNQRDISSPLANRLLGRINQSENGSLEAEKISQHVAYLGIYLDETNGISNVDITELVSFSTFLSNLGGLVGMWLGLSVISFLQFLCVSWKKFCSVWEGFRKSNRTQPEEDPRKEKSKI